MPRTLVTLEETPLSPVEREVISLFVHYAQVLNLPPSIAQIYGLLFCAEEALPFDEIVKRLSISKGSASQGLRFLRSIEAVTIISVEGDRREFYLAETRLRAIFSGLMRERVYPQLKTGRERLQQLDTLLDQTPAASGELRSRIRRLRSWDDQFQNLLPLLGAFLKR